MAELQQSGSPNQPIDFDGVRRKYLVALHSHSQRNVILYASSWLQKPETGNESAISDEDIQGFMEVCSNLEGDGLDLILHSPGGNTLAAEAIVSYLRSRFPDDIRVIVPQLAMSAATMIACAADKIMMGDHSFLGPTDPQWWLATPLGVRLVPAMAILQQFDQAQQECQDPAKITAWLPMLPLYGPDLLVQCETVCSLSQELVETWLGQYMFRCYDTAIQKQEAEKIAKWLLDGGEFKSHGRHIARDTLKAQGLRVEDLETDHRFQDLTLSVFHATTHGFMGTPAIKIIENHLGRSFIKSRISSEAEPAQPPAAPNK